MTGGALAILAGLNALGVVGGFFGLPTVVASVALTYFLTSLMMGAIIQFGKEFAECRRNKNICC